MKISRLILASKSMARQDMLKRAGYDFDVIPADIDERAVSHDRPPEQLAQTLAQAKALDVSRRHPAAMVIGSDQILVFENNVLHKAENASSARKKLQKLRGKKHTLISAVALATEGKIVFSWADTAHLSMKNFNDDVLEKYLSSAGDILTSCVGCYALEGLGIHLFEKIEGDYFTILGMPLLPLINALEREGIAP
jgi:septum formation protein